MIVKNCKAELLQAKGTKIHQDYWITYFDVIVADKKKKNFYVISKMMIWPNFLIYGPSLTKNLEVAFESRQLYAEAEETLKGFFPIYSNPGQLVLQKILNFLEKDDIKNFCKSKISVPVLNWSVFWRRIKFYYS